MPVATSIPISLTLLGIHWLLGRFHGLVLYAGLVTGYMYYEFVHYSVHFKQGKHLGFTNEQRKNHLAHHFRDVDKRYGVSSPLWDYVFRTRR